MSLSTKQLAVLSVCVTVTEAVGVCRYTQASQYAPEEETKELIALGLIESNYIASGTLLIMVPTVIGKLHVLNLSKQPIY